MNLWNYYEWEFRKYGRGVKYRKQGKFCCTKLSQYSHYKDFPGNTFAVQGQVAYMLYLEQKVQVKNLNALLKNRKNHESLAQQNFPCLQYALKITPTLLVNDFSSSWNSFTDNHLFTFVPNKQLRSSYKEMIMNVDKFV